MRRRILTGPGVAVAAAMLVVVAAPAGCRRAQDDRSRPPDRRPSAVRTRTQTRRPTDLPGPEVRKMLPPDGGPRFNRLIHETSPYLLQHARNPVDWYPWGDEAFARARREDKPVFVSIGYSTCHWCHVMERESFENPEIARILNADFVCIKVDREERPDLDEIYMTAAQLLTGSGGWPNSVWLDPEGRPFYAGAYFPPEDRGGRPGFKSVLTQLHKLWQTQRDRVEKQAAALSGAMKRVAAGPKKTGVGDLSREVVARAVTALTRTYDPEFGGFGAAPKFPPHGALRLLLHELRRESRPEWRQMLTHTLEGMASGGIHDHLGGGFHRYSTDARWFLPHFEKMLYDNAQLARIYVEAFLLTGNRAYREVAEDTYGWVLRDMTDVTGGFYSALDADSEGEEGRFYLWTRGEILRVLGDDAGERFCRRYHVRAGGNFHDEAAGRRTEANLLFLSPPLTDVAAEPDAAAALRAERAKLLAARNKRPHPHLDDNILTAWNGLMIGSLAYGGRRLHEPRYVRAAQRAADFALSVLRRDDRLYRVYCQGQAKLPGYLEDYAALADGLLDLAEATEDDRYRVAARALTDTMLTEFLDAEEGGFFLASNAHNGLLFRSKSPYDQGLPSGNGLAVRVLLRLAPLTGVSRYRETAKKALESFLPLMQEAPQATESLVLDADLFFDESAAESVVAGRERGVVRARRRPVTVVAAVNPARVAPGGRAVVTLRLDIDHGWRLNSHHPPTDALIPTTVEIAPRAEIDGSKIEYPPGKLLRGSSASQPESVYSGKVDLVLTVRVAEGTPPGPLPLELTVGFQACDDHHCAAPQRLKLVVTLPVGK